MNCYICKASIDHSYPSSFVSVDLPNTMAVLCRECNTELNGKVALVAEYNGMRTGEAIFITRKILNLAAKNIFPDIYTIYVVPPDALKILVKRILELK